MCSVHIFRGYKLMDIIETSGFPRLDNELTRHEDGLDKEWAKNRNREIEEEIQILRSILSNTYVSIGENEEIRSKISELLQERDDITFKYGLAGKRFDELYLKKAGGVKEIEIDASKLTLTGSVYEYGETRFRFITEEMITLYSKKNADYGDVFAQSLDEDGLLVSKIRIKDKLKRFSQLIDNDALVNDETMRDTLIDLANYAVMTLMWIDENDTNS